MMERYSSIETIEFQELLNVISTTKSELKELKFRLKSKGGRSLGKIVAPRRAELERRIYRGIDFRRLILPQQRAVYIKLQYDANRSARLAFICYPIGLICLILKPTKLNLGEYVTNNVNPKYDIFYGDSALLKNFSSGVLVYNIDGKYIRSAGCSAILVRKDIEYVLLKLKSGELRYFNINLIATSGTVSNENHFLKDYRKAGTKRHLGFRPRTRPASMNPVDHPMGGRTRGGSFPKNFKGIITLNRPTVKKHNMHILYTKRQLKLLKRK